MPTTRSPSLRRMPITPRPTRPIARTVLSGKRRDSPSLVARKASLLSWASAAATRVSSSSMLIAFTPMRRGLLKALRSVFLRMPFSVTITTNQPSENFDTGR